MQYNLQLLDVVALAGDRPEHGLWRGQVGTVVELLASRAFEGEFVDNQGHTYAMIALRAEQLVLLHFEPAVPS